MISRTTRASVWLRAEGRCEYCHLPADLSDRSLQVEHVVARQHGGDDDESNLALACDRCNFYKGTNLAGIDPQTKATAPLYHPRRDKWSEHFQFVGAMIEGKSGTGRCTARLLQMNDENRLSLRRVAIESGDFGEIFP